MSAQTDNLLREIIAELRIINARCAAPVSPNIAAHLKVINSTIGDRVFSASELVEFAKLPPAEDLRAALTAMAGELTARRIGKALCKIERQNIGGLCVVRCGADRAGIIWVLQVCEF